MRALTSIVLAAMVSMPASSIADTPPESAAKPAPATESTVLKTAESSEEAKEKQAFKPPAGYKTKILDWGIVYCKKTPVLGSRFPKEVCMNEAELKEHLAANEAMRRDKDQQSRICTGACNP